MNATASEGERQPEIVGFTPTRSSSVRKSGLNLAYMLESQLQEATMRILTLSMSVLAALAATSTAYAQNTERSSPLDANPACMERNVDSNSPGCLPRDDGQRQVVVPPAAAGAAAAPASTTTTGEFKPAPGLKPAPSLPATGTTPLANPVPTLPPVGTKPLATPVPTLPPVGSSAPPATTSPPPRATGPGGTTSSGSSGVAGSGTAGGAAAGTAGPAAGGAGASGGAAGARGGR